MKPSLRTARLWLRANKVFFETVTATVLSAMAIVVSCEATSISRRQTSLAERQTEIAQQATMPFFEFNVVFERDSAGVLMHDILEIRNSGAPARIINIVVFTFCTIEGIDQRLSRGLRILQPLSQYYGGTRRGRDERGSLTRYHQPMNYRSFMALANDFFQLARNKRENVGIGIERYIRIVYDDQFDVRRTEYFVVDPYSAEQVEFKRGTSRYEQYVAAIDRGEALSLFSSAAGDLWETWEAKIGSEESDGS